MYEKCYILVRHSNVPGLKASGKGLSGLLQWKNIFLKLHSQDVADDADRPHVGLGANGLIV